jgi:hypothetical protein
MQSTEQIFELIQVAQISLRHTSRSIQGVCASGKNGRLVRTVFLINEVKQRHFKRTGKSRERFKSRDCVPILYAGDVVAEEAGALLNVYLRKRFVFAKGTQPLSDDHFGPCYLEVCRILPKQDWVRCGLVLGRTPVLEWKGFLRLGVTGFGRSEAVAPSPGGRR